MLANRPEETTAVIFDYGGVLTTSPREALSEWAHDSRVAPDSFNEVLRSWMSGSAIPDNPVHLLEKGIIDAAEFNRSFTEELLTIDGEPFQYGNHLEEIFQRITPDEAMIEALHLLHRHGILLALLSNSWDNDYPADLLQLFDVVVLSGNTGMRKPQAEMFHTTLEQLNVSSAQAILIDDNRHNVQAATDHGMSGLLHISATDTFQQLQQTFPHIALTNTSSV